MRLADREYDESLETEIGLKVMVILLRVSFRMREILEI